MDNPVDPPSPPAGRGVLKGRFGRLIALSVIGLAALSWVAVGLFLLLFEPTLGQRVGAITAAALVTEGALWTCAAVFGISLFQKLKGLFRRNGDG
ncbi:hypothetical protein [Sphingopyxis panaciterrae]